MSTKTIHAVATVPARKKLNPGVLDEIKAALSRDVAAAAMRQGLIKFDDLTPGKDGWEDVLPGVRATMEVVQPTREFDWKAVTGTHTIIADDVTADSVNAEGKRLWDEMRRKQVQARARAMAEVHTQRMPGRRLGTRLSEPTLRDALSFVQDLKAKLVDGASGAFVVDVVLAKLTELVDKAEAP